MKRNGPISLHKSKFYQNWKKNVEGRVVCLSYLSWHHYMFNWTLTPKRVTLILPDIQTENISNKAGHEDAKYQISFSLN